MSAISEPVHFQLVTDGTPSPGQFSTSLPVGYALPEHIVQYSQQIVAESKSIGLTKRR